MASISEVLEIEEEDIKGLNPIYKTGYIPSTQEPQCVYLPLRYTGQFLKLEDSIYRLEKARYPSTENRSSSKPNNGGTTKTYVYHKVRSGETLGNIALKYKVSVAEIQRINGLRSSKIYVGQRLKIKPGTTTNSSSRTTTRTRKKYYTVRSGDTFGEIAQKYRISQSQLKRLNPRINISRLSIGQKIRVK